MQEFGLGGKRVWVRRDVQSEDLAKVEASDNGRRSKVLSCKQVEVEFGWRLEVGIVRRTFRSVKDRPKRARQIAGG